MVKPLTVLARKEFGKAARKAREKKGLIAGSVASKLGQPTDLLLAVERGDVINWHPNVFKKLREVLDMPANDAKPSSSLSSKDSVA